MGIVRVGGRGTSRRVADKEEDNWAGAAYKKHQEAKKAKSADKYITVGRGTGKIKFGDISSTPTKSTKGLWVSSGRGTGRRKLS
ncbi:MAG: hypothetical protein ACO2Y5_02450 [Nitrosopumilaceae archaeon]|uniref:Uncharacterized protein n=1 Tax=Candidatus Nitrosomaritimum aestuariumsis TaxID=3342354 RepID=A0AC60W3N9_9ARCH|nr:hypothetical protein [Nitrosopumilaceae archaeon]